MSTTETALTVHLLVPTGYPGDAFSAEIAAALKTRFGIDHSTIQIEIDPAIDCALQPYATWDGAAPNTSAASRAACRV